SRSGKSVFTKTTVTFQRFPPERWPMLIGVANSPRRSSPLCEAHQSAAAFLASARLGLANVFILIITAATWILHQAERMRLALVPHGRSAEGTLAIFAPSVERLLRACTATRSPHSEGHIDRVGACADRKGDVALGHQLRDR